MDTALPISVPLLPRETASSFLSRLASANGVNAQTFALELELSFKGVIDGNIQDLRRLALLGSASIDQLQAWSPIYLGNSHHGFRGETFHASALRSPTVRGCRKCLEAGLARQDGMHLHGHWALTHVTICLDHGHALVPLWRENAIYPRMDAAEQFRLLEDDIRAGVLTSSSRRITPFDRWLDNRLANGTGKNWLDGFPLHAAANFCHLLGHSLMRHFTSAPSRVEKEDRWMQYELGFVVASKGEQAIRSAFQELQELPGGPSDGPKKIFPLLYDRLARDYADTPDYQDFRRILREHLQETWPLGPGDDIMGEPVSKRRLHSIKTASRATGIDARRLRKMLESNSILPKEMASRPDAWAVFDATLAEDFLSSATELVDAKTFQEIMGISRSQFDLLGEDGVLTPAIDAPEVKAIWDPREGNALIERLLRGAILLRQAQHSWCHLSKSAARLKIRPGVLVRAILDGQIRRVGNHADFDGFAAIYVDHDEVIALLSDEGASALTIERFAKSVGIGNPTILKRLITDGHTPSTQMVNPRTHALQDYIAETDAAEFHTRFFTLRTMSLHYGMSWQQLSSRLRARGIQPFSPEGADFGSLYLRSKIPEDL